MREFNVALLGKWCWRMLVDRNGLSYRVLVARYGEKDGFLKMGGGGLPLGGRRLSACVMEEGGVEGSWFRDNVTKTVGNGRGTFFWTDPWLGGVALAVRFRRLYELCVNKHSTVEKMFVLGWGEEGDAWQWRRRLGDWEEELVGECRTLLATIVL